MATYSEVPTGVAAKQTDLRDLVEVLRRRRWVLLVTLVVVPLATFLVSSRLPKAYEASVTLQVQPSAVDTSLFDQGGGAPQTGAIAGAARLIRTSPVAGEAARRLRPPPGSSQDLLSKITVSPDEAAGFVTITARDSEAKRTADIAKAFGGATVTTRSARAKKRVGRAVVAVADELSKTPRSNKTARDQLSENLQRLRALQASQGSNAQIVEPASVPGSPVFPKPARDTALAAVLGLILGVVLAFLLERLDRRVRTPAELEELSGLPLLTAIPTSAFPGRDGGSAESEAFQTLRASLTYFNVDKPLESILICSPVKGDGKTTVATSLAVSLARTGQRVILVDADLRHPQVANRLNLDPVQPGLGQVLSREHSLEECLIDVHVAGGELLVLPAGQPPPNPSELMNSRMMTGLIDKLTSESDIVVIDSTPVLPVSDVLPIIAEVSGIVAVARLDRSTRDGVRRFQEVVTLAGGSLLGIVVTGVKSQLGYYEGYGYGYGNGDYGPKQGPPPGKPASLGGTHPPR